jgi:hypothetical protein
VIHSLLLACTAAIGMASPGQTPDHQKSFDDADFTASAGFIFHTIDVLNSYEQE